MSDPSAALVRLVAGIFREAVEDVSDIVQYILGMHYRPNRVRTLRVSANYSEAPYVAWAHNNNRLGRVRPRLATRVSDGRRRWNAYKNWGYLQ